MNLISKNSREIIVKNIINEFKYILHLFEPLILNNKITDIDNIYFDY